MTEGKFQGGVDIILNHFSKIQATSSSAAAVTPAVSTTSAGHSAATTPPAAINQPPKFIIIYDIADDAQSKALNRHLNILKLTKKIKVYNVHEGLAGSDVMADAERELAEADYILPLITDNFVSSDWLGMVWAATEAKRRVIPIRIGKADYEGTGLEKLRSLPTQNRSIADFATPDAAFADIVTEIKKLTQA